MAVRFLLHHGNMRDNPLILRGGRAGAVRCRRAFCGEIVPGGGKSCAPIHHSPEKSRILWKYDKMLACANKILAHASICVYNEGDAGTAPVGAMASDAVGRAYPCGAGFTGAGAHDRRGERGASATRGEALRLAAFAGWRDKFCRAAFVRGEASPVRERHARCGERALLRYTGRHCAGGHSRDKLCRAAFVLSGTPLVRERMTDMARGVFSRCTGRHCVWQAFAGWRDKLCRAAFVRGGASPVRERHDRRGERALLRRAGRRCVWRDKLCRAAFM